MRLIDADALKETIASNVYPVADDFNSRDYGMFWTGGIEKAIDEQPTIEERKKGEWLELTNTNHTYVCSACGRMLVNITDGKNMVMKNYPFCHCGADMRKG